MKDPFLIKINILNQLFIQYANEIEVDPTVRLLTVSRRTHIPVIYDKTEDFNLKNRLRIVK